MNKIDHKILNFRETWQLRKKGKLYSSAHKIFIAWIKAGLNKNYENILFHEKGWMGMSRQVNIAIEHSSDNQVMRPRTGIRGMLKSHLFYDVWQLWHGYIVLSGYCSS